jgi:hypothetical protein
MIGRLPESWIPPDHILDLRARVRLRHTLSQQRGEWQQRIQAVLYHHGLPQRRDLLTRENRAWVEQTALPDTAREQITVALAMIDALDVQLAPIDKELRAYAPPGRLPGAAGPLRDRRADRDHDPRRAGRLPALFVLTPGGPLLGTGHHRAPVRSAPRPRAPVPPGTAGAAMGAVRGRSGRQADRIARPRLLHPSGRAARRKPRLPGRGTQAAQAQLPHAVRARRGGAATRLNPMMRAHPFSTPMRRGRLPACSRRHARVDGPERPSGRNTLCAINARVDGPERPSGRNTLCAITPATIMSPTPSHPGPRTQIRPGARAQPPSDSAATAPVKRSALGPAAAQEVTEHRRRRSPSNHRSQSRPTTTTTLTPRLPRRPRTDKEQRRCPGGFRVRRPVRGPRGDAVLAVRVGRVEVSASEARGDRR